VFLHSRFLPSAAKAEHTVVLLHAFPLSSIMWERMASELQSLRDDTALLLIDFPGFGGSAARAKWNLAMLPVELRATIERHTRKPVTIAGLSMGGYAAFDFFRMNAGLVRALVLSNTRAEADSEEEKRGRSQFAEDVLSRGPEAAIDRLYSNFVTPDTEPEIAIDIRNWIMEAKPEAIAAALHAMGERENSRDLLTLITIPSLVISGERDVMMRTTNMRAMAAALEDSSFVEIKSAAHLTAVERPREWAEALASFLDRV
jgi:3-oxoadipate enol-lactonase